MGFINLITELLRNPKDAIAGWIAMGPVTAYGFIFLIIFIETGVVVFPFLPGDSLLFAAGFFAADKALSIFVLLGVAWAAAILGDQCNFFIGHFFGERVIASGKVKAMTPERVEKSTAFLDKWGNLAIFLGRFFPFIRTFVPFLAGMGGMKWHNFFIFNVLGGICWSTLFVLLGYFFGGIPAVQDHFELVIVGIVGVSVIPAIVGAVKARQGSKAKGAHEAGRR
ncbi:MAG: VTT domain-containing protein [Atopobiaceae bacterium]|jgi:membrane-associated protein|nr:VTT domain-containing protein [Atopobiaceae bacterium]